MKQGPELRDIHLPDSVSFWPPAPGWWAVLLLSILATALIWWIIRRQQKSFNQAIPQALQELDHLANNKEMDDATFIRKLSLLLRRTAMTLFGRKKVAGLTGEDWLLFLDSKFAKPVKNKGTESKALLAHTFQRGYGRALLDQPYRKRTAYERKQLITLVEKWLHQQGRGKNV